MSNVGRGLKKPALKPRKVRSGRPEHFCGESPRNLQSMRVKEEENEKVSENVFPWVKMFEEIALNQGLQSLRGTR